MWLLLNRNCLLSKKMSKSFLLMKAIYYSGRIAMLVVYRLVIPYSQAFDLSSWQFTLCVWDLLAVGVHETLCFLQTWTSCKAWKHTEELHLLVAGVRATGPKGSHFTLSHRWFSLTRVSGESKAEFVFASLTEDEGPYEELLNTPEDSII